MDSFLNVKYANSLHSFFSTSTATSLESRHESTRQPTLTGEPSEGNLSPVNGQILHDFLFEDNSLDTFFSTLAPTLLESSSHASDEIQNEWVFKKDIGNNVFLSAEIYEGDIKVHIRKYSVNSSGNIYPTKNGVSMDFYTWYDFYLKLFQFNFMYTSSSYVANNFILVLNEKDHMRVQTLNVGDCTFIKLDNFQKTALTECVREFNQLVIEYVFSKRLPHFIKCERRLLSILSTEEEDNLMLKLVICLENELVNVFQNIFCCNGCIIDHPSQNQHDCLIMSNLEKYNSLGYDVLLMIDMKEVATKFVRVVDFISENFVNNISVDFVKDILFKSVK